MDRLGLLATAYGQPNKHSSQFRNPFGGRPWMEQSGAAAAAPGAKGLKGIVAGGITGGIEICITFPTEYVKTQLQLDEKGATKQYNGIMDLREEDGQDERFGAFESLKGRLMDSNGQLSTSGKLLAGLGAGVAEAILAVTPMETVKVKFINDQRSGTPKYKGFFHGVGMIVRQEGLSGVYKGLTATILKQGSNQAIRFYVMETLKDMYKGDDPSKPVPKMMVGAFGAVAGAASVFGNTPIDVVKTRMQGLEAAKYKNTADCALQIWKNEGPMAFYKGTVPRLSRVCLDVAITFMIYDSFMDLFNKFWR
uniref:Citrate transport protein n=1 Tax=Anopheles melas TaxID=34690 RepID=A0A182TDP8_9DIPT